MSGDVLVSSHGVEKHGLAGGGRMAGDGIEKHPCPAGEV